MPAAACGNQGVSRVSLAPGRRLADRCGPCARESHVTGAYKHRRSLGRLVLVLAMAALMVAVGARPVQAADRWTDITDTQWVQAYGLSADQVATVYRTMPPFNRNRAARSPPTR